MYFVLMFFSAVILLVTALFLVSLCLTWATERTHPCLGNSSDVGERRFNLLEAGDSAKQSCFVLLHGASSSARDIFGALAPALSPHGRVIAPDRPGHGFSSRLKGDETLEAQAAAIWQLLDHLGVQNPTLIGHSWGGGLATAMAVARPLNVAKLVLISPVIRPWGGKVDLSYRIGAKPIIGWLLCHVLVPIVGRFKLRSGVENVFSPAPVPEDYMQTAAPIRTLKPSRFLANAQDMAALQASVARLSPHYSTLTMPIKLFGGAKDTVLNTQYHAEILTRAGLKPQLLEMAGQGHMPHYGALNSLLPLILAD